MITTFVLLDSHFSGHSARLSTLCHIDNSVFNRISSLRRSRNYSGNVTIIPLYHFALIHVLNKQSGILSHAAHRPCIYGSLVTQPMGGLFLCPSIPYLPDMVNVRFFT